MTHLIHTAAVRAVALFALVLMPLAASAQEGVVRYSHTSPILYGAPDPIKESIAAADGTEYTQGPSHATVPRQLVFGPLSSLMYPAVNQIVVPGDRTGWEYIDTTYVSFEDGTYTESREFYADMYLVEGERPVISWRLPGEERIYLGHRVVKATAVVDSAVVEAWFTPEISVPAGPGLYGGLPGLILLVTNATIGEVYAAESVDLGEQPPITAPISGRVVSDDKYDQIKRAGMAEDERFQSWMRRGIEEGRVKIRRQ